MSSVVFGGTDLPLRIAETLVDLEISLIYVVHVGRKFHDLIQPERHQ